jgi:hypothetical protein
MMTARQIKQVRNQLSEYVKEFAGELDRSERRYWCGNYMEGLLREGERNSTGRWPRRWAVTTRRCSSSPNQSPWILTR